MCLYSYFDRFGGMGCVCLPKVNNVGENGSGSLPSESFPVIMHSVSTPPSCRPTVTVFCDVTDVDDILPTYVPLLTSVYTGSPLSSAQRWFPASFHEDASRLHGSVNACVTPDGQPCVASAPDFYRSRHVRVRTSVPVQACMSDTALPWGVWPAVECSEMPASRVWQNNRSELHHLSVCAGSPLQYLGGETSCTSLHSLPVHVMDSAALGRSRGSVIAPAPSAADRVVPSDGHTQQSQTICLRQLQYSYECGYRRPVSDTSGADRQHAHSYLQSVHSRYSVLPVLPKSTNLTSRSSSPSSGIASCRLSSQSPAAAVSARRPPCQPAPVQHDGHKPTSAGTVTDNRSDSDCNQHQVQSAADCTVCDTRSILASKVQRRDSLARLLSNRLSRHELVDRNIIPVQTYDEKRRDRSTIGYRLNRQLRSRPTVEELEAKNILITKTPNVLRQEIEEKKMILNCKLSIRPSVSELRARRILQFSDYVDMTQVDTYDRRADKPWTRLTTRDKVYSL